MIVLEARDRVGGRIWNHDLGGGHVSERGGTFVGPTQGHVLALASELGVGTFPTYDNGDDIYIAGSTVLRYSDSGPTGTAPLDPEILVPLATVIPALDQMATTVPIDAPWQASSAYAWDGQTLESFLRAQLTFNERFFEVASAATRPIFGAEPRELSLLFTLFYIAASGDETNPGTFERNFNTRGGAQQSRLDGGSQQLPLKIASRLGHKRVCSERLCGGSLRPDQGRPSSRDRITVKCQARDRRGAAGAGREDRLRAAAAVRARPANAALRAGHAHEGRGCIPAAVLA